MEKEINFVSLNLAPLGYIIYLILIYTKILSNTIATGKNLSIFNCSLRGLYATASSPPVERGLMVKYPQDSGKICFFREIISIMAMRGFIFKNRNFGGFSPG
jgi:hypothetical protein